jgi:cytochrome c553
MRKLSNLALVCWGAIAMLAFSGVSFAEEGAVTANVSNGQKIYDTGKSEANNDAKSVPACVTCHGENAIGNDDMGSPKLANVGYVYIVKQLTNFAEGKRTDLTMGVMNDIAKGLTEQDRRDLAAYENGQPRVGELSNLKALATDGKTIGQAFKGQILVRYGREGIEGKVLKVPACQSCHGYNGRGADPIFPKIAQQRYVYLVNQLTHWRDGSRANDPIEAMRKVARNLTDDDINDAAAFLSQAADSSVGNGMEIDNRTVMKNVKIVR